MPNSDSVESESATESSQTSASYCCADCCIESNAWSRRSRRSVVPTMPFKPFGATVFKTSRKRAFLKRRSRPELRLGLALAVVRTVASTANRHADGVISTGSNAGKKLVAMSRGGEAPLAPTRLPVSTGCPGRGAVLLETRFRIAPYSPAPLPQRGEGVEVEKVLSAWSCCPSCFFNRLLRIQRGRRHHRRRYGTGS